MREHEIRGKKVDENEDSKDRIDRDACFRKKKTYFINK